MDDARSSVSDLQYIANLYSQIDNHLETLRDREELAGDISTNNDGAIDRRQRINDQAYFVLVWGQLETEIDTVCRSVIRDGQSQSSWEANRVWKLFNLRDDRLSGLSFKKRLSLVLERSSVYWEQTLRFYDLRNQIAHGNLLLERIDVSTAIQQFFLIRSSLRTN